MLFGVGNMTIDKLRVNFLYLPKKRLALKPIIFRGKQTALVNLSFFNDGAALSDFSVLIGNLFLGAYPLARFIKEHASGGNLDFGFGEKRPFAENQMNVIIGLALVVVQSRHTFHAIPSVKFLCEIFKNLLRLILRVDFGQGDNQFPCFDTLSVCAAPLKFLPAFPCKIAPKGIVYGAVGGVQVFLPYGTCDIGNPSFDIRQLRHLYEAVSYHSILSPLMGAYFFCNRPDGCRRHETVAAKSINAGTGSDCVDT